MDWLVLLVDDWLVGFVSSWLVGWFCQLLIVWLALLVVDWLVGCVSCWLICWFFCCWLMMVLLVIDWLVGFVCCWLIGCFFSCWLVLLVIGLKGIDGCHNTYRTCFVREYLLDWLVSTSLYLHTPINKRRGGGWSRWSKSLETGSSTSS